MSDPSGPIPFDETMPEVRGSMLDQINAKFDRGRERMKGIEGRIAEVEASLQKNNEMTQHNTEMTGDVHEILMAAKAGIKTIGAVGNWLGRWGHRLRKAVLWVAPPVAAVTAAYHGIKAWMHWGAP